MKLGAVFILLLLQHNSDRNTAPFPKGYRAFWGTRGRLPQAKFHHPVEIHYQGGCFGTLLFLVSVGSGLYQCLHGQQGCLCGQYQEQTCDRRTVPASPAYKEVEICPAFSKGWSNFDLSGCLHRTKTNACHREPVRKLVWRSPKVSGCVHKIRYFVPFVLLFCAEYFVT